MKKWVASVVIAFNLNLSWAGEAFERDAALIREILAHPEVAQRIGKWGRIDAIERNGDRFTLRVGPCSLRVQPELQSGMDARVGESPGHSLKFGKVECWSHPGPGQPL